MYTIERGQLRAPQLAMKFGDFIAKNRQVRSFRSEMRGKKELFRSFSKTKNSAPKQNLLFILWQNFSEIHTGKEIAVRKRTDSSVHVTWCHKPRTVRGSLVSGTSP